MATTTFTTKFNLTTSPKKFVFIDTTDWVGQGIALADVNSSFKITSPSGTVIYNNTDYTALGCDINTVVSTTNQIVIQLPLGLDGFPEEGDYTIIMTSYDSNLLTYSTKTNVYTYSYVRPVVSITQSANTITQLFTSTDATNYVVNLITPVITRVHTINYPFGSAGEGSPVIGSAATITTTTFYNGTQTTEIESSLVYTFSDDLIILDSVTGVEEILVDASDICAIYCCVKVLKEQMLAAPIGSNSAQATKALFTQVMGLVGFVFLAKNCNMGADVSATVTEIKELANCTDDCSCSDGTPTQVIGLSGLVNNVVVESAGAPLTVTPVTVGNTTTYTIAFDGTLLTKLNTLYNTVVAAGDNVTVSSSTVGYVTTYTVNGKEAIVTAGDNITVTPSGPVAGDMTYEIDGEASTVSAGYGIAVTPGAPVAGVTDFAVASSLSYLLTNSSGSLSLTPALQTVDSLCAAVVPSTGVWFVLFEGGISSGIGTMDDISIAYSIAKNTVAITGTDRSLNVEFSAVGASQTLPIAVSTVQSLVAGQTIQLTALSTIASTILTARSITLIRIA